MSETDAVLAARIAHEAGRLLCALRAAGGPGLGPRADAASNAFLLTQLRTCRPDDAVLSEESADDAARRAADRVWIIDPLDGTREYAMPGRTDWAVHVALWQRGRGITAAAVALPALDLVYGTGVSASGACGASHGYSGRLGVRGGASAERSLRSGPAPRSGRGCMSAAVSSAPPRILVSDSRPPAFAAKVAANLGATLTPMGSAGAKAMAVLRGEAQAYVHAGGQWEWDSAAPVGVAVAAGLHASRVDGSPLEYNQPHPYLPDLIICRKEAAPQLLIAIGAH